MEDASMGHAQPASAGHKDSENAITPKTEQIVTNHTLYLNAWRLAIVTASLCLGTFLVALDTTIISVAVPKIATDFQAINDVRWYGSAYLLTVTAFQPAFGSVYRLFNTKLIYLLSILIFEGKLLYIHFHLL